MAFAAIVALGVVSDSVLDRRRLRELEAEYEMERLKMLQAMDSNVEAKAESLLLHVIGKAAYMKMMETGYIELPSKRHSGRYRIHRDARRGVQLIDGGDLAIPTASICIYAAPDEVLPTADQLVTLYMIAKYDEHRLHTTGVVQWRSS